MSALSIIIRLSPSELVILLFELHHELKLLSLSLSAVLKGVLALIDLSLKLLSDPLITLDYFRLILKRIPQDLKVHAYFLLLALGEPSVRGT